MKSNENKARCRGSKSEAFFFYPPDFKRTLLTTVLLLNRLSMNKRKKKGIDNKNRVFVRTQTSFITSERLFFCVKFFADPGWIITKFLCLSIARTRSFFLQVICQKVYRTILCNLNERG